jgi:hypothetical protein
MQPETSANEQPEPMRVWLFGGFRISIGEGSGVYE